MDKTYLKNRPMNFKKIFLFLGFTALYFSSFSQIFPVQATTQLSRPYSLYLSDYTAPGSERLSLNIFLTDATRTDLNVRLRLRIEGQGIRIETKPGFIPPPLTLNGGVPLQLISADLAAYFEPRNLDFSGTTQREYEQKGSLPEGLYQFCFEVYEYNRNVKISNTGCATAWLILNDPPIINLPRDNEKVRIQSPQQVTFQWTPRHTGSPNSAFTTEYDFKLVEVWPSTRNPNDAILTSRPIYETTTTATTLIYGATETALEPGRRYAFQIKARSIAGVSELNLFKNNGLSQVSSFVFGDACLPPQNIVADATGPTKFSVKWDAGASQTAYNLRYRLASSPSLPERGTGGEVWYTTNSLNPDVEIKSLQPSTRYEYQVGSTCGLLESAFSPVVTITTKPSPAIAYSCGVPLSPFNLDLAQMLDVLKVGDVIQAGDFDVTITKASGGNGNFSGEGAIVVPYFNQAKVKAEFAGIAVNKEMRMVSGFMNVTGAGVEVIPSGVLDFMDQLSETLASLDSALDKYEENLPKRFDEHTFVADKAIVIPGTIASVVPAPGGGVVVTDDKGNKQTIPAGTSAAITDSTGKGYLVDKKGGIHQTTAAIAAKAGKRGYNLTLKFAEDKEQRFGFDELKTEKSALASTYDKLDGKYDVAWKSVAAGSTDKVQAILEGTGMDKSKIHFEQFGQPLSPNPQAPSPNAFDLTVQGKTDGTTEGLVALYTPADTTKKEQVLGQLNVVTYNEIAKNLVIVPVNGNKYPHSEDALRTQLNKIYGQAVVKWNITFANSFEVPGIDPFDDGGSGLLSNYSQDMRKVVSAYKANIQPNTYYLFLVKNPKTGTLAGYMPRSKECGFIFVDKNGSEEAITRTMAHELGHGAFSLQHTFATTERYPIAQGTTDNLMDYTPSGMALYKFQWDRMRYPEIVMGVFESDKGAKSVIVNITEISDFANKFPNTPQDKTFTFIAPSGLPITIPPDVDVVTFSTGINYKSFTKNLVPLGTLESFVWKGDTYDAYGNGDIFTGYKISKDGKYYDDVYSRAIFKDIKNYPSVIIGTPCYAETGIQFKASKTNYYTEVITFPQPDKAYNATGYEKKGYSFLFDTFSDQTKLLGNRTILANTLFGVEALNFLSSHSQEASCVSPESSYYATHASLIHSNSQVYRACGDALGLNGGLFPHSSWYYKEEEKKLAEERLASANSPYAAKGDLESYFPEIQRLRDKIKLSKIPADPLVYLRLTQALKILQTTADGYLETKSLPTDKSYIEATKIFAKGACICNALTIQQYVALIEISILQNEADIFIDFLAAAPSIEMANAVLDKFKGDGQLLGRAIGLANYNHKFYYIITGWLKQMTNNYSLATTTKLLLPNGNDDLVWYNSSDSKMYFGHTVSEARPAEYAQQTSHLSGTPFAAPFDIIEVTFTEDFAFKDIENTGYLTKDKTIKVPAIWLTWLTNAEKNRVELAVIRVMIDVVAIAAIPFTAGTSSTWVLVLEGAMLTADIAFTVEETYIRTQYKYGDAFLSAWNATIMVVGGVQVVKGIGGAINRIEIINAYKNGDATTKALILSRIKNLLTEMGSLKGLTVELAANMTKAKQFLKLLTLELKYLKDLPTILSKGEIGLAYVGDEVILFYKENGVLSRIGKFDESLEAFTASNVLSSADDLSNYSKLGSIDDLKYVKNGSAEKASIELYKNNTTKELHIRFTKTATNIDNIAGTGISVSSLKKLEGKASSQNIPWGNNLDEANIIWANPNNNVLSTAKSFANETGASLYDAVLNNNAYVKFDLQDGRILLGSTRGSYQAFAVIDDASLSAFRSSILNVNDEVFKTKLFQFLSTNAEKLKVLAGLVSKPLTIAGQTVTLNTRKVNTLLGRFRPDVENLFNELGSFKNVGLGETEGGINILNKPDYYYDADTWWSAYNRPWLDKAIQRGDDIYLATIPQKADEVISEAGKLKGAYAQELDHLAASNYKPKNITELEWGNIKSWLGIKNPNWIEITGIVKKVEDLIPHVLKVETDAGSFILNPIKKNGATFNIEGFRGCHTENALKEYVQANGGTYAIKNPSIGAGGVYTGQPVIYLSGKEYVKINGTFVEYEVGKWGGTSTFFPKDWADARIIEEVKYAVENNHGLVQGSNSLYYGFSKDGVIEIRFAFNSDGSGTYYAIKK
jgi:Purple acid Phosphatase, N-terminal domain/Bacterial EndoU nuclease